MNVILESVYVLCKLALQVAGLVLGDDVLAAQTVEELVYLGKGGLCLGLVGHFPDAAHHGA